LTISYGIGYEIMFNHQRMDVHNIQFHYLFVRLRFLGRCPTSIASVFFDYLICMIKFSCADLRRLLTLPYALLLNWLKYLPRPN